MPSPDFRPKADGLQQSAREHVHDSAAAAGMDDPSGPRRPPTSRRSTPLALAIAALLASLWAQPAAAYCRTTTCTDCPRDPTTGCVEGGEPLSWASKCVSLSVQVDGSSQADPEITRKLVREAFAVWENAECDDEGHHPSIQQKDPFGPVVCPRSEYFPSQSNANTVVYRDEGWPYENRLYSELASTSVRFDDAGNIVDADMEINSTLPILLPDAGGRPLPGSHDLLSLFVHEIGHYLGLDHSRDPRAIMQPSLPPRVVRVELAQDDVDAICEAYPPERKGAPCEPDPTGGFSAECGLDPATGGACAAAPGRPRSPLAALPLLALGAWLLTRRRQRVRH